DGIRDLIVTGVQTCALPISEGSAGILKARAQRCVPPDGRAKLISQSWNPRRDVHHPPRRRIVAPNPLQRLPVDAEIEIILEPAPSTRTMEHFLLHPLQLAERGGQQERLPQDVPFPHVEKK